MPEPVPPIVRSSMPEPPPEVVLYVVDAGGGHRATARALVAAAEERQLVVRLSVVNIKDVLAPLDVFRRTTGTTLEDVYNAMIRRQYTRYLVPLLRTYQWLIRRLRPRLVQLVAADLAPRRPALVLSLFPNFNAVFAAAVKQACPGVSFRVLLTDFADFPPGFWMEPEVDGVILASDHAVEQAARMGLADRRVIRTSGMVLHPRFYPRASAERRQQLRSELGLTPEDQAVLVLFGGKGSPEIEPLCAALLREAPGARVIAVCGDNPRLYERVARLAEGSGGRLTGLGFTDRMAHLMSACDLLVTKPGPGSLAEAFHLRIPVVVCCNESTIPQERFNASFVETQGVGLSVPDWRDMAGAAAGLLADPSRLAGMRERLAALPENTAVYEVLDFMAREVGLAQADARPAETTADPHAQF
jgi:hypothetical protein